MKKLTLISLLAIIVLSQFGYYCFCAFQIYEAKESSRKQILNQIPENLLTKISIDDNSNDIRWEEEGKEFSLNGSMYDVAKIKTEEGKNYLLCISDAKEDEILNRFSTVVKNNIGNPTNSTKHQSLAKFSIPEWISDFNNKDAEETTIITKHNYFSYNSSLLVGVIEINSPPPNFYI